MKKPNLILIGQTITAILCIIAYLIKTFIIWEFTNPFNWIINMPNYDNETRGMIIVFIIMYYGVLYSILYEAKNLIFNSLNK